MTNKKKEFLLEWQHQAKIFEWAERFQAEFPEIALLNGSLNGVRLSIGQAVKAKRTGLKKGFPDIFLPVSRNEYHGLFIELKRKHSGVVSADQKTWLTALNKQGYLAIVCKGSDATIELIQKYLDGDILKYE